MRTGIAASVMDASIFTSHLPSVLEKDIQEGFVYFIPPRKVDPIHIFQAPAIIWDFHLGSMWYFGDLDTKAHQVALKRPSIDV